MAGILEGKTALIFGVANLAILWWRIKAEDEALRPIREAGQPPEDSPAP